MKTRISTLIACGLTLAAMTVAGCGKSYSSPSTPTPTSGTPSDLMIRVVSTNGTLSFSPSPATITVGQTVSFYDADVAEQAVVADGGVFSTEKIPYLGTSVPIMMNVDGTFTYHLQGNPAVVGILIVGQ